MPKYWGEDSNAGALELDVNLFLGEKLILPPNYGIVLRQQEQRLLVTQLEWEYVISRHFLLRNPPEPLFVECHSGFLTLVEMTQ